MADEVIGDLIAAVRRANGWSQNDLADRLNLASGEVTLTRSEISRWERGTRVPQSFWGKWIAAVAGIPLDRVQAAGAAARQLRGSIPVPSLNLPEIVPNADDRDRIDGVLSGSRHVDRATLEWIKGCLGQHRVAEDTVGADPIAPVARAQLGAVADIANRAEAGLRSVAVDLAAQYAQFLGWMAVTKADHGAATAWYMRSQKWADDVGDAELAATALSMRAHHAWGQGDPRQCRQLVNAADGYRKLSPGLRGMLRQTAARGCALAGDKEGARAELDRASELLRSASDPGSADPDWLYFYNEDWLLRQRGTIELQLGNFAEAAELLGTGYQRIDPSYQRDQAWIGSCLSMALASTGEADESVRIATDVASNALELSRHAVANLREVHRVLKRRAPGAAANITELMRSAGLNHKTPTPSESTARRPGRGDRHSGERSIQDRGRAQAQAARRPGRTSASR